MTDLRPYKKDRRCPKCRFAYGTTEYHEGHHWVPPVAAGAYPEVGCGAALELLEHRKNEPRGDYRPAVVWNEEITDLTPNEEAYKAWHTKLWELINGIPEHFDRECPNCRYRWAEGVA